MSGQTGLALIFPGQGSQGVGMGRAIAEKFPSARAVYEEADDILGFGITKLCFEGPEEELTLTRNSQPAIFITSIACFTAMREFLPHAPAPSAAAGLSLGEFSAHVAAGSFSFAEGLRLVRKRAEAMQEVCDAEPSTMASIVGLDLEAVQEICSSLQGRGALDIANLNCPGQVAVSGAVEAVKAAMEEALKKGALKAVQLQVSGAFHSRLMKPAEDKLREAVKESRIVSPEYPVIANATALPVAGPEEIGETLVRQLCSPVLWEKSIRYMIGMGIDLFIELGHGRVLSGLLRRIDKKCAAANVQDPDSLDKLATKLPQ